ncbi:MAG: N-acetyltransferase [Candidatus Riflebacteria bacterium]|nr:N-acetyltransferase [Candidatus Riflebacteria bacterium]
MNTTIEFFAHESAFVDENVTVGKGTKIWHFSHIMPQTEIGDNCVIGQNCSIGPAVKIGRQCKIQNNVSIYKGVELEDGVFCGPSMVFTNVNNPRAFIERKSEFRKTLVKKGASIGANCTIVCGHTVGAYSFIGAGAVVTRNVPDYALMLGVPAKVSGWVCACGIILTREVFPVTEKIIVCPECHAGYRHHSTGFQPQTSTSESSR